MTTRKRSRIESLFHEAGLADNWDSYDPYGSASEIFFSVALVLDASDIEGDASPEPFARWQYRRAPFAVPSIETITTCADDYSEGEFADDYSYAVVKLACAYENKQITQDDLIFMGDILSRYVDILHVLGKSY